MKVKKISIKNFKGIADKSFSLDERFTVFIGNNASGKTTVLDAMAVALGCFFLGVGAPARPINWDEVRVIDIDGQDKPQLPVEIWAEGSVAGVTLQPWGRKIQTSNTTTKEASPIRNVSRKLLELSRTPRQERAAGMEAVFPIIAYHGTGRLWAQHEAPKKHQKQIEGVGRAYVNALSAKSSSKDFLAWVRTQDDNVRKFDRPLERAHLKAFLQAIESIMLDQRWHDVKFDHAKDTLSGVFVDNAGRRMELAYEQLSDGFKNVAGIIADIAFRCIQLNPHLGESAVVETPGVVLIDELDLHLHPNWQKRVVLDLKNAFPNIQFIATTHSPFIVQSLEAHELVILDDLSIDEQPNSMPLNRVATELMGVDGIRSDDFEARVKEATQKLESIESASGRFTLDDYKALSKAFNEIALSETDDPEYKAYLDLKIQAGDDEAG